MNKIIKDGTINGKKIELRDKLYLSSEYEVLEIGIVADTVLFSSTNLVSASNFFDDLFKEE